jgi:transcriptional regulator with XRE-family HTH domain
MSATAPEEFGPRLRALRVARGLSLSAFARQLFYSKGHVSRVETGVQAPSAEFARRCDAALEAGGELAALVPAEKPAHSIAVDHNDDDDGVWMMIMTPDGGSSFVRLGRRDLLFGAAATILTAGGTTRRRRQADPGGTDLVGHRRMLDATRELGQTVPPDVVLPTVVSQAHTLRTLFRHSRGRDALEVALLYARTAEYAGWMSQESGDNDTASWWTGRAVAVATEAGDQHTAAYALVRRALITMYQGDATATVAFARAAQADSGIKPRILGLAAQREAQGHALAGDYDACMRALDVAARRLAAAQAESGDGPVIGTTFVPDPVAMVTGWCLHDLGRPKEAAAVLDREIARIPAGAIRARTRFGMRQTLAHAAAGNLDRACELAGPMIEAALTLDSATILADLRRLATGLRRWHSHPAVRALEPALGAALYGR